MGRIKAKINAPFGEITIEGENAHEILQILQNFPEDFMEKTSNLVSKKLTPTKEIQLKDVVEFSTEGPLIVTREKLTHYEAVGIILHASKDKKDTSAHIKKLLKSSGMDCMVPARLHEMAKRGQVFKPDPNKPQYKLTVQGERWIQDEVLPRLRGKTN